MKECTRNSRAQVGPERSPIDGYADVIEQARQIADRFLAKLQPVPDLQCLASDVLLCGNTAANSEGRLVQGFEAFAEGVRKIGVAVEKSNEVLESRLRPRVNATLCVAIEQFDEIRSSEVTPDRAGRLAQLRRSARAARELVRLGWR